MPRTVPDDVLDLVKPAVQKRIEELVESAFKLAAFGSCPEVLEKAIDDCSSKHFDNEEGPIVQTTPGGGLAMAIVPTGFRAKRVGSNIVVGDPHIRHRNAIPGRSTSYAPGNLVKASKYSKLGRPVSEYAGVTYSGSVNRPWLTRYKSSRIGAFVSEVEAARAYDEMRVRDGKEPVNFSPAGKSMGR
jgi:hypothetical protein